MQTLKLYLLWKIYKLYIFDLIYHELKSSKRVSIKCRMYSCRYFHQYSILHERWSKAHLENDSALLLVAYVVHVLTSCALYFYFIIHLTFQNIHTEYKNFTCNYYSKFLHILKYILDGLIILKWYFKSPLSILRLNIFKQFVNYGNLSIILSILQA